MEHSKSLLTRYRAKMKASTSGMSLARNPGARLKLAGGLLVFMVLLMIFNQGSSASSPIGFGSRDLSGPAGSNKEGGRVAYSYTGTGAPSEKASLFALLVPAPPAAETVSIFAGDCSTPKTSFNLGEKVCAVITDAVVGHRIVAASPGGYIQRSVDVNVSIPSGTFEFSLPTTATSTFGGAITDNRGTWIVSVIDPIEATVTAAAKFVVHDPAQAVANLTVDTFSPANAAANTNFTLKFQINNFGPDTAQTVQFTDAVPSNTTFVSETQTSGPTFTCNNPFVGQTGTTACTIGSLAKDAVAEFQITYKVNSGVPVGTVISNTANISSATTDADSSNNSSNSSVTVSAAACVVTCPSDITQGNDPDQYGAVVSYQVQDNGHCGIVSSNPPSGSFFPVGTTAVTAGGDTGSCSFHVTINDTQPPAITCPSNVTTTESAPGQGATVSYPPPTATDNGPTVTTSCDHASGSHFDAGDTPVVCTATDAANNTATCTFHVIVTPSSTCVLTCPADITVNNDPDACGANVTFSATGSDATCDPIVYTTASGTTSSGSFFPVGTTLVTARAATGQACRFNVTVVDAQAPTISCPANITVNAGPRSCAASVSVGTATAADNCSAVRVSGVRDDNEALTNPYPVGTTFIKWTATDRAGNATSCTQTVTVRDVTPPTASVNVPDNVVDGLMTTSADANCQALVPDLQAYLTASDNCSASLTVSQTPVADTLVGVGQYPITIKVSDGDPNNPDAPAPNTTTLTQMNVTHTTYDQNGNPQVTIVRTVDMIFTVNDNTPPSLTVPLDSSASADDTCHAAIPDYASQSSATDSCSTPTITQSPVAGTSVGLGPHNVVVTASDGTNSTSKTVVFTVNDTTAPSLTAQDSSASADANCQAPVPDYSTSATATDNCGNATITQSPAAGTMVGLGPHDVIVTATDAANNSTSKTVVFTVNDTTAPTVSCPAPTSASADANCQAPIPNVVPGASASDNCSPSGSITITQSPAAGTMVGSGPHTITVTAKDAAGNSGTCTTTFTVNDTTPPTISCPAPTSASADANCQAPVPDVRSGATTADNCGAVTVTQSPAPGTMVGQGPHTITLTATDGSRNSSSCTTTFTVNDTTAPTITCPANITTNSEPGTCAAHVTPGTATATDNCDAHPTITGTRSDGRPLTDTYPGGTTTITWTATDSSGNHSSCQQTVTVNDTENPTITIDNGQHMVWWPPNHQYETVTVNDFVLNAHDNCDSTVNRSKVYIWKITSDEAENGPGSGNTLNDIVIASDCKSARMRAEREGGGDGRVYTIYFKVKDAAGNFGTATAKVYVPKSGNGNSAVDSGPHYTVNSSCP